MANFTIYGGDSATYVDTTPNGGVIIDFSTLDNSFSVQINGVELFVGGPDGAPNELQFQESGTYVQTVRFADGDLYGDGEDGQGIYQIRNTNGDPIVRLEINPDGRISLSGVKGSDEPLEPLELFNGLFVNSTAIEAAWNDDGENTIVVDQISDGPTNANGNFEDVPCFVAGSMISTIYGQVPVENLSEGDSVLVYRSDKENSEAVTEIRRIFRRKVYLQNPKLRPVKINAGALGDGLPTYDLLVSRQHCMLVQSKIAERMFGVTEVLVPAIKLTALPGIYIEEQLESVEYLHLLLDNHEVIYANDAPTESLFTGSVALKAINPEAREEIMSLFPEIADADYTPIRARHVPEGKQQKRLIARHLKNNKPCLSMGSGSSVAQIA